MFRLGLRSLPALLWAGTLAAQTCIIASPPKLQADNTASIDLWLYSSTTRPSALEWVVRVDDSLATRVVVNNGPALTAAGKTVLCMNVGDGLRCLAVGANSNPIANGVIAKISATPAAGFSSAAVQVADALAATPEGHLLGMMLRVKSLAGPTDLAYDCRRVLLRRSGLR
jgi:hypothetical protein